MLRLARGYLALIEARRIKEEEEESFFASSGLVLSECPSFFNILAKHEGLTSALEKLMELDVEYLKHGEHWGGDRLNEYEASRQKAVTHYEMMLKMVGYDVFVGPIKKPILSKSDK